MIGDGTSALKAGATQASRSLCGRPGNRPCEIADLMSYTSKPIAAMGV